MTIYYYEFVPNGFCEDIYFPGFLVETPFGWLEIWDNDDQKIHNSLQDWKNRRAGEEYILVKL